MGLAEENIGLINIIRDPILKLDKNGRLLDCHLHDDTDSILKDFIHKCERLEDYEFLYDLEDAVKDCLVKSNTITSYFSLPYGDKEKHYEVLLEPVVGEQQVLAQIKEVTKRKQREKDLLEYYDVLQNIYKGTSSWTGHDFLDHLTLQLASELKADFAGVCLINHKTKLLELISSGGVSIDENCWKMEDTPFENVVSEGFLEMYDGLNTLYPKFKLSKSIVFGGFVGVPLFYNELFSKPIGMMMALNEGTTKKRKHNEKILHIFSSRAAAELERIESRKKLEQSEEKFKALYNNTPALFSSAGKSGKIIEVGDYFLEKSGYSKEEVIGKNSLEFLTEKSKKYALKNVLPSYIKKGFCRDIPFEFVKKDKKVLEVLFSSIAVKDKKGQYLKSVMSMNDVTKIRKTERELKASEAKVIEAARQYQSLFQNSPMGIIIHADGIIKHVNDETIRLARGRSVFDFLGREALSFVHPDSMEVAKERIEKIYRTKGTHRNEQKFLCIDGSVIEVEAMGSLIEYEGEPAVQIAFYDISDRKEAQRKIIENGKELKVLNDNLAKQNNQLEEFAHIASHNLRAPVANMISLIQIMNIDPSPENEKFVWENITKTIRNLDETIVELNDVVKTSWELDKNKRTLKFQKVLDKVLNGVRNDLVNTNANIVADFSAYPSIYYPKVYLESILQNLVTNSLKYKHQDRSPKVLITTWRDEGRGYLSIEDNGIGLDLKKYGDKLFGLRKTFHSNNDARGVGLFITKAQIESLGGSITVESKVGIGTKFTLEFGEI